ncbi:TetR family transcriptional regulator [Niastella koreensis]|jgi:AcrR family transcriptional regulator|uniref:Transcriptional regulator, TetR family n=3 Tax=Niastella TaxID=354354 RepID=G8T7M2_NIAKG|nr:MULTISPECIES: TetR/AcrR family transcriptional regulator [Niastella]AEW02277.1 transcriptional regulator, TetR family [Niastella koreensis GR20-10]MBO9199465.1 TetR family transcriptional regulator [Niastella soli]OQP46497.1 TetR family transcriptional regulator [Niastella koreensis]
MAKIKRNRNGTRKDVIIAKAAKLFREKGFSATSMRDLAEHVGVEAASLYNHISSKAEILQEICFKTANNFMSHIEEVDANPNKTAIEKIQEILRFHIKQMLDNYEEVYVSDREWKHLTDPYLSNMQSQRRAYRQRIASVIEEGIRKGEIKPIDAPTAVLIMLHAVSGIESWHRSKKKIAGEVLEDNMVQILVDGLRKQA